jgi:hypothetical protein
MNKHQLRAKALELALSRYPPTMSDEDARVIATAEKFVVFLTAGNPTLVKQVKATMKDLLA